VKKLFFENNSKKGKTTVSIPAGILANVLQLNEATVFQLSNKIF